MNGTRAIVAVVAMWLLGIPDSRGAEKVGAEMLLVARGVVVMSVQCGEVQAEKALVRQGNGAWNCEWAVATDCSARLETIRVRRPVGIYDAELLAVRLTITNRAAESRAVPVVLRLAAASLAAPTLRALAFERHAFFVEGQPILVADTPARGAILAESAFAARPLSPQNAAHVTSAAGECRGEMFLDLTLAPGQTQTVGFFAPSPSADAPEVAVTLEFLRSLRIDEFFPAAAAP